MAKVMGHVMEGGVGTKWEPVCAYIYACGVNSRARNGERGIGEFRMKVPVRDW